MPLGCCICKHTIMSALLIAAFPSREDADAAIIELEDAGYTTEDISVITKETAKATTADTLTEKVGEGAASGATTGGLIGGIAGLLAGAGVFPALAGLLIGGPIAAALGLGGVAAATVSGVVTGAVAGGLIGALTTLGVSKEDAEYYSEMVEKNGYLVAVPVDRIESVDARAILDDNGATRISEVAVK